MAPQRQNTILVDPKPDGQGQRRNSSDSAFQSPEPRKPVKTCRLDGWDAVGQIRVTFLHRVATRIAPGKASVARMRADQVTLGVSALADSQEAVPAEEERRLRRGSFGVLIEFTGNQLGPVSLGFATAKFRFQVEKTEGVKEIVGQEGEQ